MLRMNESEHMAQIPTTYIPKLARLSLLVRMCFCECFSRACVWFVRRLHECVFAHYVWLCMYMILYVQYAYAILYGFVSTWVCVCVVLRVCECVIVCACNLHNYLRIISRMSADCLLRVILLLFPRPNRILFEYI